MNKKSHQHQKKPKSNKWKHVRWSYAATSYVDTETGESLTKKQYENENYITESTEFLYHIEDYRPIGWIYRIRKGHKPEYKQRSLF